MEQWFYAAAAVAILLAWVIYLFAVIKKGNKQMKEDRPPKIGDVVHYTNLGDKDGRYPPEQQAAIVTRVRDPLNGDACLHIFYPTGQFDMDNVPFSEEYKRGHWSWPVLK